MVRRKGREGWRDPPRGTHASLEAATTARGGAPPIPEGARGQARLRPPLRRGQDPAGCVPVKGGEPLPAGEDVRRREARRGHLHAVEVPRRLAAGLVVADVDVLERAQRDVLEDENVAAAALKVVFRRVHAVHEPSGVGAAEAQRDGGVGAGARHVGRPHADLTGAGGKKSWTRSGSQRLAGAGSPSRQTRKDPARNPQGSQKRAVYLIRDGACACFTSVLLCLAGVDGAASFLPGLEGVDGAASFLRAEVSLRALYPRYLAWICTAAAWSGSSLSAMAREGCGRGERKHERTSCQVQDSPRRTKQRLVRNMAQDVPHSRSTSIVC